MLEMYGLALVSIQFSSKCRCSSHFGNLVSCSLLTSWLCCLSCRSQGDVIYGTSYLYSLSCPSCGDGICGTFIVYLVACTIVGTKDGSTLPLIIFYALTYVLSYSFFTPQPKALPSSTLFFFLKAFLGKSAIAFFLFFNVVYISSLVLLTLLGGFCGFSF